MLPEFSTSTLAAPSASSSDAGSETLIFDEETTKVGRGFPFQRTTAPGSKPDPSIETVIEGDPVGTARGEISSIHAWLKSTAIP